MSTFFGGPQLVNQTEVSGSGSGTYYTVPAGRYAEVKAIELSASGSSFSVDFGGSSLGFTASAEVQGGVIHQGTSANAGDSSIGPITLSAGDTVSSGAAVTYKFQIFEYLLP